MQKPTGKRILIIDDEIDLVTTLVDTLKFKGYEVTIAYNGVEGLEKAIQGKPDLILLDMMMPGMNGAEVCRQLRKNSETKNIKIMILSAKAQISDIAMAKTLGANDYMIKPYELEDLLDKMKVLVEEK